MLYPVELWAQRKNLIPVISFRTALHNVKKFLLDFQFIIVKTPMLDACGFGFLVTIQYLDLRYLVEPRTTQGNKNNATISFNSK
jgi:hypothetical protein